MTVNDFKQVNHGISEIVFVPAETSISTMATPMRHMCYSLCRTRLFISLVFWVFVTYLALDCILKEDSILSRVGDASKQYILKGDVSPPPMKIAKVSPKEDDTNPPYTTAYTTITPAKPPNEDDNFPPCGEVCEYSGSKVASENKYYKELTKEINCDNIMKRMANRRQEVVYPPPEDPPEKQYEEFTQFGDMPVKLPMYMVEFSPDVQPENTTHSNKEIKDLIGMVHNNFNINGYDDKGCMMNTLKKHKAKYAEDHGVVIGTQTPWLEAMLLAYKAGKITTLEYTPLTLDHPKIEVFDPYTYGEMYFEKKTTQFDFGASFSSLEHSGLGRYGDPLNPYGDMEAMAQAYCMMKPGGIFFLGIPGSYDDTSYIRWNAQRMYGSARLQHITANWKLLEYVRCKDEHIVLVLKRR